MLLTDYGNGQTVVQPQLRICCDGKGSSLSTKQRCLIIAAGTFANSLPLEKGDGNFQIDSNPE